MKKIFLLLITVLCASLSHAESCPNIADIKNNNLKEWLAYDSDESIPLTVKQYARFRENISAFALAEWQQDAKQKGVIHCYYRDKNGSPLDAYLSKGRFIPDNSHNRWYSVSGSLHCAADKELCAFKANADTQMALQDKGQLTNG